MRTTQVIDHTGHQGIDLNDNHTGHQSIDLNDNHTGHQGIDLNDNHTSHQIASNNCVLMIITRPCAPRAAVAWKSGGGGAHIS